MTENRTEFTIPKKYKAVVYDQPGKLSTKVVELDVPEPGHGEVLINLTHSGVCHSDYAVMTHSWRGILEPPPPNQVGGHEGVGHIVKLGPGTESSGLKIGDRVGVKWMSRACLSCLPCISDTDGLCFNQKVSGYTTPGTFQQYVIGPANYVIRIPDGLSSPDAAPMLCAGLTVYAALKRSKAQPGQWMVITGAGGGLGHLAVQLASRGMGLRVIGTDFGSKEEVVKASGAEHFVDITKFDGDDLVGYVRSLTGGIGAHAVLACTSSNADYAQALRFLRFNGTLVCVGLPEGDLVPISSAAPSELIVNQWNIVGSMVGNRREAAETLEFAARGIVKPHYHIEKMENLTSVFERMQRRELVGRVVLDLS